MTSAWICAFCNPSAAENEVMSWVPPYAIAEAQAAATMDFGACDAADGLSRVGLQFWTPNWDGTIKYADHEWYTPGDADVAWWTNWCAANGIGCLLTIYNNDGTWNWDLARAAFGANRATFVAALAAEMDRLGLDGVDVDLEGIGDLPGDRAAFAAFIAELGAEVHARGKVLTVDSFPYIWNAPNVDWWGDWVGNVDNIHSMGYSDLYEGGTGWRKYSWQQAEGMAAGYAANQVMMGMPGWLASWGVSSGRGTSALAHVEEVANDLPAGQAGIAIWDLQLTAWRDSSLWCEIAALRDGGPPPNAPPSPNPAVWASVPAIDPGAPTPTAVMTAATATDPDGGVEYLFDCVEAPEGGAWNGCEDSLWQASPTYADADLAEGATYSWRVRARDALGAMTAWSPASAVTVGGNNAAPTPDPMVWATPPSMDPAWPGYNVGTMVAATASDPDGGIEYFFDCVEAPPGGWWRGCEDSGWQAGASFSDWYLEDGATYRYRAKARDGLGNETAWSAEAVLTVGGDNQPPAPDPMTWLDAPYLDPAWPGDNVATMTATTATDPDGGIEYFFDCVEAPPGGAWRGCEDSGWQAGATFSDWYLEAGATYRYRAKARDGLGDETGWSAEAEIAVPGPNAPPTAAFTWICADLDCAFTNASTDDVAIAASDWSFGDGATSSATNPAHGYAAAGSYLVTLTVTDDDGASDAASETVTVAAPAGPPAAPSGLAAEVQTTGKGRKKVVAGVLLTWTDNAANEDAFVVERCEETGKGRNRTCPWSELATVGAGATSLEDDPGAGAWTYRVKAINAAGASDWSNEVRI